MNWKRKPVCAILLWLLVIALPLIASAATDAAIAQEIHVTNTPIRGTIEIDKQGPVLTGFSEHEDAFGYTVHTPQFADGLLAGAVYEVRAAEDIVGKEQTVWFKAGELAATITTAADGLSATDPLPLGRYVVTEVSAPDGYVLDETRYEVVLSAADHDTELVRARLAVSNELMPARISLTKEKETVSVQQGEDGMCTSVLENCPGEGFIFGLFTCDPIPYGTEILEADTLIATGITDEEGELTFSGEFPHGEYYVQELFAPEGMVRFVGAAYGRYTIRELEAPEGYLLSKDVIHVTLDDGYTNSPTPLSTVVNRQKKVSYIKVNTSGTPIPGVEFSLFKADTMEKVETAISDKNGVFTFSQFDYGDWIIRETAAPEGYCRMEDIRLHVGDDWTQPAPILCVNIPDPDAFLKTDSSGVPLPGVKVTVEDASGKSIGTYESDKDGIVSIRGLKPGEYFIKEIETLEGYSVSGEIIRLKIDEYYVVPDTLRRFINYTTIQTGVNLAVTGIMWVGLALMAVSGTLGLIRKRRAANGQKKD